jgi:hypothetical protein
MTRREVKLIVQKCSQLIQHLEGFKAVGPLCIIICLAAISSAMRPDSKKRRNKFPIIHISVPTHRSSG